MAQESVYNGVDMSARRALIGFMVLFLLASTGLIYYASRSLNSTQTEVFAAFDFGKMPPLGNFTCAISRTDAGGFTIGEMYVRNKQARIDLIEGSTHILVKDDSAYVWHDGTTDGVLERPETVTNALMALAPQQRVSCERTIFMSKSLFQTPFDVVFKE